MAKTAAQTGDDLRTAIAAGLKALTGLLGDAVADLTEAQAEIDDGRQNAAVDRIGKLDTRLADARALYQGILVLHRQR